MEIHGDYEYHTQYGLLLCATHSCPIAPDHLDVHLELDLRHLIGEYRATKKEFFSKMREYISETHLPLEEVARKLNSLSFLAPFLLLAQPVKGFQCQWQKCKFMSISKKGVMKHLRKSHLETKDNKERSLLLSEVWIQYLSLNQKYMIRVYPESSNSGTVVLFIV